MSRCGTKKNKMKKKIKKNNYRHIESQNKEFTMLFSKRLLEHLGSLIPAPSFKYNMGNQIIMKSNGKILGQIYVHQFFKMTLVMSKDSDASDKILDSFDEFKPYPTNIHPNIIGVINLNGVTTVIRPVVIDDEYLSELISAEEISIFNNWE